MPAAAQGSQPSAANVSPGGTGGTGAHSKAGQFRHSRAGNGKSVPGGAANRQGGAEAGSRSGRENDSSAASHNGSHANPGARPGRKRRRKRNGGSHPGRAGQAAHAGQAGQSAHSGQAGHANQSADSQASGQIRNLRPPVRPREEARFDPSQGIERQSKRGGGRHERPSHPRRPDAVSGYPARSQTPRPGHGSRPVFAALDLGTNNCRLLMAVPTGPGRFRVVDAFSRIIRLGEGLQANGRLSDAAMDRAVEVLSICAAKLHARPVAAQRLIATEACRRAENGAQFLERVKRETGLDLEIVDRETEARLAAEGCGSLMDPGSHGAVLFDIGGGSSELILVDRRQGTGKANGGRSGGLVSPQIVAWTSMPLGVVTLSERHGGRNVSRENFSAMVAEVREHLDAFEGRNRLSSIWHPEKTHLLGTSGTVTTIAGVHLELPRYDRRKVDGIWLSSVEVDKVIGDLVAMDYEARALNPCIGRERADLVLAGCAILEAIRETWPSPRLRVADRGLREGILSELMHAAGEWGGNQHGTGRAYESGRDKVR
ncbi:MAG: hypothetical protein WAU16_03715 [Rhizobiaceae bacterium]